MAVILATAKTMKELSLLQGSNDYAMHVNDVKVVPRTKGVTWKGGTPTAVINDYSTEGYDLVISLVNDYENPTGLFKHLLSNIGVAEVFTFKPSLAGTFAAVVTATILEIASGGAVDQFGGQTVTFPCTKPTYTFPS